MDGLPTLVYKGKVPGEEFDDENMEDGMFEGWLLSRASSLFFFGLSHSNILQVGRHIFVSPRAALDRNISTTSRSNSVITGSACIVPEHIAYLVLAVISFPLLFP